MREILFRAKRVDNGEWVYWNHLGKLTEKQTFGHAGFCEGVSVTTVNLTKKRIDFDTTSEYSGVTDKNDKKVFDGDIVKCQDYYVGIVRYGAYMTSWGFKHLGWWIDWVEERYKGNMVESLQVIGVEKKEHWQLEVIGNIYDNAELLEKK